MSIEQEQLATEIAANEQPEQTDGIDIVEVPVAQEQQSESVLEEQIEEEPKVQQQEEIPKGLDKRINKLTREKREAEERAYRAEQDRLFWMQKVQGNQQQAQQQQFVDPYAPKAPDESDPKYKDNIFAYTRDFIAYQNQHMRYEQEQRNAQVYKTTVESKYQQRVSEAREKYEDFDDAISSLESSPSISSHPLFMAAAETIKALDNSADVAYYFGKNPSELVELMNKPTTIAVLELGKLSNRLEQKQTAKAPTHVPPISLRGSAMNKGKTIDQLSVDELAQRFRSIREK